MNYKVSLRLAYYSELFSKHSVKVLFFDIMKKYIDLGNDYVKTESHKEIDLLFADNKKGRMVFGSDRATIYIFDSNELVEISFTSSGDVFMRQFIYSNSTYIVLKYYIKYDYLKLVDEDKTITEYNMEASTFDAERYYDVRTIEGFKNMYDEDFYCLQDQAMYHGTYESKLNKDVTSYRYKDNLNKSLHGILDNSDLVSSLDYFLKNNGPVFIYKTRKRDNE